MNIGKLFLPGTALLSLLAGAACTTKQVSGPGTQTQAECLAPGDDDQTAVQTALIEAQPGSTICLGAGTFSFTTELSLDVDGVTLSGAGQGKTILDFSGQDTGGNG